MLNQTPPMQKIDELTLLFKSKRFFLTLIGIAALTSCVTPQPHLPMVLAREALAAAKDVDAARYAPGLFYKAEESFRKAMNNYNDKSYYDAIVGFDSAREFAEKAEDMARVQRQKAGDEAL